jgi:N-acetylmuramoyl-L-alanine amidase
VPQIAVADLARLLDATKFWRADARKLVLRTHAHRLVVTVDNPFALVDDATVLLPAPARSRGGELLVPVALLEALPRDTSLARLMFDPARRLVFRVPAAGIFGPPHIGSDATGDHLVFAVDRPEEVVVASRSREHFRLRFGGLLVGALPEQAPSALVLAIRQIPAAEGSALELQFAPEAKGFRLTRDAAAGRVQLTIAASSQPDFESFAPEAVPGPVRVVVLDPGHGGADPGVTAEGLVEKDLALALARRVKLEVERRSSVRVILTRDDDRDLSLDQRAERANRARADLVVSLHFDGLPAPEARGATAFCPPATYAEVRGAAGRAAAEGLDVLPWRDVALRHAVRSRELADDLLSSLELRGAGPTRLREVLPCPLLGVNAPGLLLECATLTSPVDRARLTAAGGLDALAAAIADGLAAYQRQE